MGQGGSQGALEDRYHLQKIKLGHGSFATVWRAVDKQSDAVVAVKTIEKASMSKRGLRQVDIEREVAMMKACLHENLLRLLDLFEDAKNVNLVLEFCEGGDFGDKVKERGMGADDCEVSDWVRQICSAIFVLHGKGICHRDIKPDNFLVGAGSTLKLSDFGLAVYLPQGQLLKDKCGTPGFMAPEQHKLPDESRGYGLPVDIWAAGISMFMLMCGGRHPFLDGSGIDMDLLFRGSLNWVAPQGLFDFSTKTADTRFPDAARTLCQRMVNPNPGQRLPAALVLQEPWLMKRQRSDRSGQGRACLHAVTPPDQGRAFPPALTPPTALASMLAQPHGAAPAFALASAQQKELVARLGAESAQQRELAGRLGAQLNQLSAELDRAKVEIMQRDAQLQASFARLRELEATHGSMHRQFQVEHQALRSDSMEWGEKALRCEAEAARLAAENAEILRDKHFETMRTESERRDSHRELYQLRADIGQRDATIAALKMQLQRQSAISPPVGAASSQPNPPPETVEVAAIVGMQDATIAKQSEELVQMRAELERLQADAAQRRQAQNTELWREKELESLKSELQQLRGEIAERDATLEALRAELQRGSCDTAQPASASPAAASSACTPASPASAPKSPVSAPKSPVSAPKSPVSAPKSPALAPAAVPAQEAATTACWQEAKLAQQSEELAKVRAELERLQAEAAQHPKSAAKCCSVM